VSGLDDLRENQNGTGHRQFGARAVDLKKMRPIEFLWHPWLVRGRLNLMVGEENVGKSTFACYIAAQVTTGKLPGMFEGKPGKVLFVGADEDDWNSVTVPQLIAAGADIEMVRELFALSETVSFDADRDSNEFSRVLGDGFALVIFEHLMDVLPPMRNANEPVAVRRVMRPLRRTLAARGTTGLGTLHVNKAEAHSFRQRTQGSMQWGAMARSAFLVDRHPTDPLARVAVLGKANYVQADQPHSISFSIASDIFECDGWAYNVGKVVDVQASEVTMEDVLVDAEVRRLRKQQEQRKVVLAALTSEPQSGRAISKASNVPLISTQRILADLEAEGLAEKAEDGWLSNT
jgi:hypothetical protein